MNVVELIVYILVSIFVTVLLLISLRLFAMTRSLNSKLVQANLDKQMILFQLEKMSAENSAASVEKTDGFLRFISDSREWAFKYIEDVQTAIKDYDEALSKQDPNLMNEAYKKLVGMLPEDTVS